MQVSRRRSRDEKEVICDRTMQRTSVSNRCVRVCRTYILHLSCFQVASVSVEYEYTNKVAREDDSFGVDLAGRVAIFPQNQFAALVALMQETFPPDAA